MDTRVFNGGTNFSARTITFALIAVLSTVQHSDAQTQIGFEFYQSYSSIAADVASFQSALVTDIKATLNNATTLSGELVNNQRVTNGSQGRILFNFTLNLDTTLSANIVKRNKFEKELRTSNYVLHYNSMLYTVDNSTVRFDIGFWDHWHQFSPEITIAILCGLLAIAIFISSIQLLCMNRKNRRKVEQPRRISMPVSYSGNSLGRTNGGFVMDEINGGFRMHTPKSSIGSARYGHDRNLFYDKLIYGAYEVPAKHMNSFL